MTIIKNDPGAWEIKIPAGTYDVIVVKYTGSLTSELRLAGDVEVSQLTIDAASRVSNLYMDGYQLRGTSGDDKFDLTGIDYIEGGINLGGGNDTFLGASTGVRVDGGSGNDTLYGSDAGLDRLLGGEGDDIIYGLAGLNTLSGGAGKDIFVAAARNKMTEFDSENTITDFVAGTDKIDISAYGISSFRQLQFILDSTRKGDAHFEAWFGQSLNIFTLEGRCKR